MNAAELMAGGMKLIGALSPFALVYLAIACSEQLVGLLRKAAGTYRRGRY